MGVDSVQAKVEKTKSQGSRSMARIPEVCAPVNARTQFETAPDEAAQMLRQTTGARFNALPEAIVSYVVGRPYHVRRQQVSKRLLREGKCRRCGPSRCRPRGRLHNRTGEDASPGCRDSLPTPT